jgi:hypothetical protein
MIASGKDVVAPERVAGCKGEVDGSVPGTEIMQEDLA